MSWVIAVGENYAFDIKQEPHGVFDSVEAAATQLLSHLYADRDQLLAAIDRAEKMITTGDAGDADLSVSLRTARIFSDDLALQIRSAGDLVEGEARDGHIRQAFLSGLRISRSLEEIARIKPHLLQLAQGLNTLGGRLTRNAGTPA